MLRDTRLRREGARGREENKKEREKEGKIESGREGIQRPPVIHWNILIFHALQEVHRPVVEGGARKIKGKKKKKER